LASPDISRISAARPARRVCLPAVRARRGGWATGQPQGVGSEACLISTSQGPTPEDVRKDGLIIRARCAPLSPASGFPVSRSQQEIRETSGLVSNVTNSPLRVSTLISHRINSCLVFAEGKCPHKLTMERVYIIPHLMDLVEHRRQQSKRFSCKLFIKIRYYPTGLEIDDPKAGKVKGCIEAFSMPLGKKGQWLGLH